MGTHEAQRATRARKAIGAAVLAGGMLLAAPGGIAIAAPDTDPGSATTGPDARQPIVFHVTVVPGKITFGSPTVVPGKITFGSPTVVPGKITFGSPTVVPGKITFGSPTVVPGKITIGAQGRSTPAVAPPATQTGTAG